MTAYDFYAISMQDWLECPNQSTNDHVRKLASKAKVIWPGCLPNGIGATTADTFAKGEGGNRQCFEIGRYLAKSPQLWQRKSASSLLRTRRACSMHQARHSRKWLGVHMLRGAPVKYSWKELTAYACIKYVKVQLGSNEFRNRTTHLLRVDDHDVAVWSDIHGWLELCRFQGRKETIRLLRVNDGF